MAGNTEDENRPLTLRTADESETLALAQRIGAELHDSAIVALVGDLGSGKTWFAKGLARGLGVPDREYVTSPAFDLVHEYGGRLPVFHVDFYRLDALTDDDRAWLEEYFHGGGVTIVEWADKFIDELSSGYLRIEMRPGNETTERILSFSAKGREHADLLRKIEAWPRSSG